MLFSIIGSSSSESLMCYRFVQNPYNYVCLCFLSEREFNVKAKCVINATGPYTDSIRTMGSSETKKICQPSSGVHVVLPNYYRFVLLVMDAFMVELVYFVRMKFHGQQVL